jgi:hypothetical protein
MADLVRTARIVVGGALSLAGGFLQGFGARVWPQDPEAPPQMVRSETADPSAVVTLSEEALRMVREGAERTRETSRAESPKPLAGSVAARMRRI